ncbi:MAG: MFS transporter [Dehalococcoidia bacterium]
MTELTAPGWWVTTFGSLKNRDFRWFWLGMVMDFAALQMQILARGWLVYQMTSSPLALGLVTVGWGLPVFLFALVGGTVADRVPKRRLIVGTEVIFSLLSFLVAGLILSGNIAMWHLVAAAVVSGLAFTVNGPARMSFIPELVPEGGLMNAYALNYAGLNLMRVAAPAIGGLLVAVIGVGGVYLIIASLYGLAALTLMLVGVRGQVNTLGHSLAADLRQGLDFVRHSPTVPYLLAMFLAVSVLAMPYLFLLPVFAADVLHVGEVGLGWMMAMVGLGAVAGTLSVAGLGDFRRKGLLLLGLAVLFSLSLLLFSLSSLVPLSRLLLLGVGAGNMGYMAVNQTLLQSHTPQELRGRVSSLTLLSFGLATLGVLGFSALAEVWGAPLAVGLGAAALLALALVSAFHPRWRGLR